MNRKFFVNHTIHTVEDLKSLASAFRSFVFVNNERAEALTELTAIVNEYNAELKDNAVATVANAENILEAMTPSITLDEKTRTSGARKRAVLNAVCYTAYRVDTDKNEIRAMTRAVTMRDIYAYKCELLASAHADKKVTKADREKAVKHMFSSAHLRALRLFMVGAFRFENVVELVNGAYVFNESNTEENALFLTDKPSKANAEKQIKATATACGLGEIPFKRVHALTLYKRAYTIDKGHQPKTADLIDFAQDFTISARYAKNNIDLPEVIDRAGIFATDTDEGNDDIIRF